MAVAGSSLRLKRIRRRFGIGAPRLAIKAHVAWYWKALATALSILVALTLAVWVFEAGKGFAANTHSTVDSANEIMTLTRRVIELDAELEKSRNRANAGENTLEIERATLKQLSRQVKSLELENASLKEDLTFFEGLMPSTTGIDENVRIEHFRIEPEVAPGEFRYRMLVINGGQGPRKDFRGDLRFVVKARRQGKDITVAVPSDNDSTEQLSQYRFETKYFRRLEGNFSISPEDVVLGVEARLVQDNEVRAKQYVAL